MRKIEKRQIIKNVSSSWFSLGINVIAGFLLSPYILHRLGDTAFGIWVLIFSVTGYYGLFDLGIRSSIVRYVSKFTATGDREELAKLINTSLFTYSCIGVLTMLVTLVVASQVDRMFRIPPEFLSTARWLLLMVGASVAIGFPVGIFGGFLEGLQSFYILNWTNVVSTLLRAALIVLALNRGYGLLTVALITVVLPLLASLLRGFLALRLCPVPFGVKYVDRATFRQIANYGGISFMIMVAGRLKFKTDEIVIGAFMSAAAITYFNIGARIVDYAGQVVIALSQIFVPMSSQSDARGDMNRLRKIFLVGNRVCGFTIFPVCVILLILGKSVIEVWVGKRYIAASYPVLVIMILCSTLWFAQGASGRILFGMSKHGTWAVVTLIEGVSNLILSIILVRPYGIIGDALGTAIPLTCSMLFFMPQHLCKKLNIRLRTFVRESYTLPFLLCLPLAAVLLLMQRWFIPHNYRQLAIQLFIGVTVYGVGLLWTVLTNQALRVGELSLKGSSLRAESIVVSPPAEAYQQDV
jgi:O-antigen/teichoic acid export membrane protein